MALLLQKAWEGYWFVFDEIADHRTKTLPFVAKPYQGLTLLGLYLMIVLKWGPQWMKNRQPFNVDKILIAYNAFQVIACTIIFVMSLRVAWWRDYKWLCEPVDFSEDPKAVLITKIVYSYYLLKIVDLMDTIFFVLRKKFNQISFLHIYHHTGMVLLIWGAITYFPGGHGTLIGVINSFVHMVMYSYYLLTVAKPSIKNAIWIKKHVTQLQILQFFCCVVHVALIVFKTDCEYPRWVAAVFLPQNLFMLLLFIDFYIKTYIKKPKEKLLEHAVKLNNGCNNNNVCKNSTDKLNGNENVIYNINNKNDNLNVITNNLVQDLNAFDNQKDYIDINSDFENGKSKLVYINGNKKYDHHKQA